MSHHCHGDMSPHYCAAIMDIQLKALATTVSTQVFSFLRITDCDVEIPINHNVNSTEIKLLLDEDFETNVITQNSAYFSKCGLHPSGQ